MAEDDNAAAPSLPAGCGGTPGRSGVERESLTDPVHWTEALAELHRWSTAALTAGAGVPVFGSPAWCALADEDPAKAFAAARAALAWWAERTAEAERDADDYVEASHTIAAAEDWSAIAREPSYEELERRRRRA